MTSFPYITVTFVDYIRYIVKKNNPDFDTRKDPFHSGMKN